MTWVWTVLTAALLGFEVWSLVDRKPRTTWSAWFYDHIRAYLVTRLLAYPLLAWTAWHWLVQTDQQTSLRDHLAPVGVGLVLALVATTRRTDSMK
jgi:hypothetical protein